MAGTASTPALALPLLCASALRSRVLAIRTAAALATVVVLAGCSASPTEPAPSASNSLPEACAAAAETVVQAAGEVVAAYAPEAVEAAGATPAEPDGDPLGEAVETAIAERDLLGCNPSVFRSDIAAGLDEIEADGPLAAAVQRRVTASILGTGRTEPGEWMLAAGADLHDAVARAVEGTTIVLPAGTWELDETLVLLDGVLLRGAGRDATTLRSSAGEAAVVAATASLVRIESLTVEVVGDQPASAVVGGPNASIALTEVRLAGAVVGEAGEGGAGLLLSAPGDEASGGGTTLEVTDSLLEGNGWAGIAVSGGHRVSIVSTAFVGNGDAGMLFLDQSSGSVRSSTFIDNGVGIAATGSATPTWLGSSVSGGAVGLQLDASAMPVIDGMTITGTSSAAVIFGGESGGRIEGTNCPDVPYGIVIADTAAPTLGANECAIARGGE
ncbi:right-handed parallel beta-helix repeat-containing protein [Agrococcus sp. KRD186]|uniref:right-handed parallel beta-helix repeat-containing protein n=1 Tax=Agrococcus sp. KRD186 TaxID=2729730 RepID=UPI0019D3130B|nr:right-handed parallel beta-helix repeat-containing protein [Agrococcus sp. KRD186]